MALVVKNLIRMMTALLVLQIQIVMMIVEYVPALALQVHNMVVEYIPITAREMLHRLQVVQRLLNLQVEIIIMMKWKFRWTVEEPAVIFNLVM